MHNLFIRKNFGKSYHVKEVTPGKTAAVFCFKLFGEFCDNLLSVFSTFFLKNIMSDTRLSSFFMLTEFIGNPHIGDFGCLSINSVAYI